MLDTGKSDPLPKMPGGKKQSCETPRRTALREMEGETGLRAPPSALRYANVLWRPEPGPHWLFLYVAHIEEYEISWQHSGHPENEGEIPRFWDNGEFEELRRNGGLFPPCTRRFNGFFPPHEDRLLRAGLIEPLR